MRIVDIRTEVALCGTICLDVSGSLSRIPHDVQTHSGLEYLKKCPAGVRVAFRTNSKVIKVAFNQVGQASGTDTFSAFSIGAFDIVTNGMMRRPFSLLWCKTFDDSYTTYSLGGDVNDVVVYMPTYSICPEFNIYVDDYSDCAPIVYQKKLLFYGTSITQGAASCRPALNYASRLCAMLGCDYYNFGFGGNAIGDHRMVGILKSIDSDLYIIKSARQAYGNVKHNIVRMVREIKEVDVNRSILIISALGDQFEVDMFNGSVSLDKRRKLAFEAYDILRKEFSNIYFADGLELLSGIESDLFHDGVHPNSIGHKSIASRLFPIVQSILARSKTSPNEIC